MLSISVLLGPLLFSWGIWGICIRVAVSTIGHWTITYVCHNPGPGLQRVEGAAVQASNLPLLGVLSHGACWHNNHHAFPESAQIGLEEGQADPVRRVIQLLQKLGLARKLGVPRPNDQRGDLLQVRITT